MPKEVIAAKIDGDSLYGVQVGWSHRGDGGTIQIGVGKVLDPGVQEDQSWWSDLDRKGCNDLIRVLRRARNAAFGGDE